MSRTRLLIILSMFILLVCSIEVVAAPDNDPARVAEMYLSTQLEAVRQKQPNLIRDFFDLDDPVGKSYMDFETGRLAYFIACWEEWGSDVTWYSTRFKTEVVSHHQSLAHVRIQYAGEIKMADTGERLHRWNDALRDIILIKDDAGKWRIRRDDYFDYVIEDMGGRDVNFSDLISEATSSIRVHQAGAAVQKVVERENTAQNNPASGQWISINRDRFKWYGQTYTDDTESFATNSYNKKFKDYASGGGDCQNFLSQAYYYAFGGADDATAIGVKSFPMTADWWATSTGTSTTWNWTSVNNFYTWITTNRLQFKTGVQGRDGNIELALVGDYIFKPTTSTTAHVWLIVDAAAGQKTLADIYLSGHTANHNTRRGTILWPSGNLPTGYKVVWVENYYIAP